MNLKKIGAEAILIGMLIPWVAWATISIKDNEAKANRVIATEEKLDYIYKYIIEQKK